MIDKSLQCHYVLRNNLEAKIMCDLIHKIPEALHNLYVPEWTQIFEKAEWRGPYLQTYVCRIGHEDIGFGHTSPHYDRLKKVSFLTMYKNLLILKKQYEH